MGLLLNLVEKEVGQKEMEAGGWGIQEHEQQSLLAAAVALDRSDGVDVERTCAPSQAPAREEFAPATISDVGTHAHVVQLPQIRAAPHSLTDT